jgi:hypothetical protein
MINQSTGVSKVEMQKRQTWLVYILFLSSIPTP